MQRPMVNKQKLSLALAACKEEKKGFALQGTPTTTEAAAVWERALHRKDQGAHLGLTPRSWKVMPEGHFWSLSFPKAA